MEYIGYVKYRIYNIGYSENIYNINKVYIGNNEIIIYDESGEENLYGKYDKKNDIYIIDRYRDNDKIKQCLKISKCKIIEFIKNNNFIYDI